MTHQSKFSLACAVLLAILGTRPAAAQTCIQDVWKAHGNNQNLTCSAKDVALSNVTNINITAGGQCVNGVCKCFAGGDVTFTADFQMNLTADTRYDIGFYIATDGDITTTGALTGQCSSTNVTAQNSSTFHNLDPAPDTCGDITGALNTAYNPQIVRQTITMPCTSAPGTDQLALPWCTTWRQPGSNTVCQSANDAYPGSPSKCNCGLMTISIFTETASITVDKKVTSGPVPETGGSASYSVTVSNVAKVAYVALNSLTDDKYGDITTTHAAGGGFQAVTSTTCELATIPGDGNACPSPLPNGTVCTNPGNPYTCTFTGTVPPGDSLDSFTDTVTACGADNFGHSNICDHHSATVLYSDVPVAPSIVKSVTGLACQIDATYNVSVTNNSPRDTLTLNSLSDNKFGDITSTHAAGVDQSGQTVEQVVSTTCSAPQTIPVLGDPSGNIYTCSFQGRTNNCALSHVNVVTGTATDADGVQFPNTQYPNFSSNSATVNINVTMP
jgi:hypothetical protein